MVWTSRFFKVNFEDDVLMKRLISDNVFTNSALLAELVLESPCPSVCVFVCLCVCAIECSFFGEVFFTS